MERVPTITDVAQEAQVAISTVSRCLSGHPHVTAGTRKRIVDACRKLNYQLNPSVQDLAFSRGGRTRSLAFVLCGRPFSQPQYAEIIDPLFAAVNRRQYHMTLIHVNGDEDCAFSLPNTLRDKRVDGVLITGMIARPLLEVFERREIPFVVMGNYDETVRRDAACVQRDWSAAFRRLTTLMREHDVTRPALVLPNGESFSNREYLRLYSQFLTAEGFDDDPARRFIGCDDGPDIHARMREVFMRPELPFDGLVCMVAQMAYAMDRFSGMRNGFSTEKALPIYTIRHATLPYQLSENVYLIGNGFDNVVEAAVELLLGLMAGTAKRCVMMV